jgi:hypothetical protein
MRTLLALGSSVIVALLAGIGASAETAQAGPAAAPAPVVGHWVGRAQQRDVKRKPFTFTVDVTVVPGVEARREPARRVGRCAGTMRFRKRSGGAYVFALSMRRPRLPGTVRLRMLGRSALRYTWDGRYPDGSPARSTGKLARAA